MPQGCVAILREEFLDAALNESLRIYGHRGNNALDSLLSGLTA